MTSCYCDDGDAPSAFKSDTRKARKVHQCDECRRAIEAGDTYEHVWGVWDGPLTFKTCPDCLEFRRWFEAHIPCVCWQYGSMFEIARDQARQYDHDCPGFAKETDEKIAAIRAKRRKLEPTKVPA